MASPHPTILSKRAEIVAACELFNVSRLDIFGSATRGDDFDPHRSDADFLVVFPPDGPRDHYFDLKDTIERILGRPVDLVERQAVEASRNYIRRRHILSEAQPFYVA